MVALKVRKMVQVDRLLHIGSCRDRIQEVVPGRAAAVRQAA